MAQIYLVDNITKTGATTNQISIHNYSIHGYGKRWLSEPRLSTISPIVSVIKETLVYGRETEER
jgi:hypothetical protein